MNREELVAKVKSIFDPVELEDGRHRYAIPWGPEVAALKAPLLRDLSKARPVGYRANKKRARKLSNESKRRNRG